MNAAEIVLELAAKDAPLAMADNERDMYCVLCRSVYKDMPDDGDAPEDHGDACPWRLARQWAARQKDENLTFGRGGWA